MNNIIDLQLADLQQEVRDLRKEIENLRADIYRMKKEQAIYNIWEDQYKPISINSIPTQAYNCGPFAGYNQEYSINNDPLSQK